MPVSAASIAQRVANLSPRERIFLGAGAAAILLFLLYLLIGPDGTGSEPAPAPQADLGETQSVMPPVQSVMPPPGAAPEAPPATAPVVAVPSLEGVTLYGVLGGGPGGGAVIVGTEERQRVVRVGREVVPGARLKEVGLGYAVVETGGGDMRIELRGAPAAGSASPAAPAPAPAASATPAASVATPEQRTAQTLDFRTGLAPHKEGGRTTGFTVRPGARMPMLQSAGLRPGDIIVAVNGQAFTSEEKVMELSDELATSYTAEIDYLRAGKPMKARIDVNRK